jgi:subtilase family serine protease
VRKRPFYFNSFVFPLFMGCVLVSSLHAQGIGRQQLHGHVPAAAQSAHLLSALDPTTTLILAIGLPLRNTDDLQNFLDEVYKPGSSLYRQFLTPEQFTAQYGPSQADVDSVVEFARANHLTVVKTHSNHMLVDVQGSAGDIQKAFHVNLNSYSRSDGSVFHAPDREPSIDLDTPVLFISGLEDSRVPRPGGFVMGLGQTVKSVPAKPNGGTGYHISGTNYAYIGKDYRNVYLPCLASSVNGAGQVLALVEFDTYYANDISLYAAAAGLAVPAITNISIDGFSTAAKPGGGDEEVSLDIEMAMSMAPDAGIYVYEEKNGSSPADDLLNQIANDDVAHQISCSWTGFGDATTSNIFLQYAAQGQAFFQAAGDLGSYINGAPDPVVPGPIDRSSLMTVVGGTQLTTSGTGGMTAGSYTSESTWNSNVPPVPTTTIFNGAIENLVGGGGICGGGSGTSEGAAVQSVPLPIPTYQVPFVTALNGASSIYRNIPDVAMCAITMTVFYNNGKETWGGGTSAATPLWAGLFALADQLASETGDRAPIGNPNLALYTLAQSGYAANFHDIADGSNNDYWGNSPTNYTAVTGYDLTTGLGSPQCAIVSDLVAFAPVFTPTPTPPPASANMSYTYPEPASSQITFVYASPSAQTVEINVYTFSSQEVASFIANAASSNTNLTVESMQGFANGVYFYVIRGKGTNSVLATGKFVVVH